MIAIVMVVTVIIDPVGASIVRSRSERSFGTAEGIAAGSRVKFCRPPETASVFAGDSNAVVQRARPTQLTLLAQWQGPTAENVLELGAKLAGHAVEDDGIAGAVEVEHDPGEMEQTVPRGYTHVFVSFGWGVERPDGQHAEG